MNDIVEEALIRKREIFQAVADIHWKEYTELAEKYQNYVNDLDTCLRLWKKHKSHEIVEFP